MPLLDRAEQSRIVEDHLPLARSLARRFLTPSRSLDDLEQVAAMGLVKAAQRFDTERGVEFSAYARATAMGELKRFLRDKQWSVRVPRSLQEATLAVHAEIPRMSQELGRSPSIAEISDRLDLDQDLVIEALEARSAYSADSLDRQVGDEDGSATLGDLLGSEDETLVMAGRWSDVSGALETLPERERHILYLRFFDGLSQSEIGEQIGISQMHVSRLLRKSLETLRSQISGD